MFQVFILLPNSIKMLQAFVHNMCIYQPKGLMSKSIWGGTDDFETESLPKGHSHLIGAHYHIELNPQIPLVPGKINGKITKHTSNSFALKIGVNHVAAICNVVA